MKKLMCALAAVAAGACFAEGISSANVVGYASSDVTNASTGSITLVTPQFKSANSENTFKLSEMTCPAEAADLITLNVLKPNGTLKETYYWTTDDNTGMLEWEDGDYNPVPDKSFICGQAFWLQCDVDGGSSIQSAGQVNTSDVTTELNSSDAGSITIVGNTFATSVNIQDILCPSTHADKITLNVLKPNGTLQATYYWTTSDETGKLEWEDGDYEYTEVEFAPGQTFWVQCDIPGGSITFPGTEL